MLRYCCTVAHKLPLNPVKKINWTLRVVSSNVGKSGNNDTAVLLDSVLHRNYRLAVLTVLYSLLTQSHPQSNKTSFVLPLSHAGFDKFDNTHSWSLSNIPLSGQEL